MSSKGAISLLLLTAIIEGSRGGTRYILDTRPDASRLLGDTGNLRILHNPETRRYDESSANTQDLIPQINRRSSYAETSTFNPDVLNKFLEDYANKIKHTTDKNYKPHSFPEGTEPALTLGNDDDYAFATINDEPKSTESSVKQSLDKNENESNDTLQRHKYWSSTSQDDRTGWVTLDAVPWSKSKISKWQANPSTQNPWPDMRPWDSPNSVKPWQPDYPSSFGSNKPWYNRPKPNWENQQPSRPSYPQEQSQKWPPERPSWDQNPYRPDTDIETDNRPSNFPNNWNKIHMQKPSFSWNKFGNEGDSNDWEGPSNSQGYPGFNKPPSGGRPSFSNYQYESTPPSNHPANGDGQWVLLSTNRGYSKSRQRSIKFNAVNGTAAKNDPMVPVLTSKRQVRLTVLPSINGTNTTTSHGGLLEVEKTFQTVDQSQKEYERRRQMTTLPTIISKRPTRQTVVIGQPSNSAVLAAVGAGMLPASLAMLVPMMLGRRKRSLDYRSLGGDLSDNYIRNLARNYESQRSE